MPGWVMVPVLSTHSTSTLAKASMLFMSWSRTFRPARRTVLRARAAVVSRYRPSGIMPMMAAIMDTMLVRMVSPFMK